MKKLFKKKKPADVLCDECKEYFSVAVADGRHYCYSCNEWRIQKLAAAMPVVFGGGLQPCGNPYPSAPQAATPKGGR
jgi:hypothetical protein